ncbi:MAG: hypothetical protein KA902_05230 [Arenimonas sp.]|nr:hypothetical protein [Arenimonas sp.]
MLCAGDEFGNSQSGNNNAYCQDNPIGWLDWSSIESEAETLSLLSKLIALRQKNPLLRYPYWFADESEQTTKPQLHWYTPNGDRMTIADWHDRSDSVFACQVQASDTQPPSLCVVFNPQETAREIQLANGPWRLVLDTSQPNAVLSSEVIHQFLFPAHSLVLLVHAPIPQELTS